MPSSATKTYVYLGSGSWDTEGTGKLQVYAFDQQSAALAPVQEIEVGDLNSFAVVDSRRRVLYVTDEVASKARSYAIDPSDGKLTFLSEIDTQSGAVFSTLDASGEYLLVAYYNAGGVEVFALGDDGTIGASVDYEATGDQAHSVALTPDNRFAFVPNKGTDQVSQFTFDATSGTLTPNAPASVSSGGDGPRHMAFHPSGAYAYLLNETDSQLTVFSVSSGGTLSPLETVPNVAGGAGGKASSDIHVTADGKFVYASNRDDDNTIAMFSIGGDGKLTSLGHQPSQGQTPRNFAIHPTSNLLLVGNQESSSVASFRILADGRLEFIESTDVGAAVFWVGFLLVPLE